MRKFNVHFIAILLVLFSLITVNWQYGNETFLFFGFAENKETEIRLEHPVIINTVYATAGKRVKKGELLLEVTRPSLQLEQHDLNFEVARLKSQHQIWVSGVKATIRKLQAEKASIESDLQTQIQQLESEMHINESLVKDLQSIDLVKDREGLSPNQLKIQGLKKELQMTVGPITSEIQQLYAELKAKENPTKIQIDKLQNELGFVEDETTQLSIRAPGDGIIGSIFCKEGEQLPSFQTLVTFYQENPTIVKGYVLESLILNVGLGDSLQIHSSVMEGNECFGKVIGLGSRIVEIPERLRKIPHFKTYGREVTIRIPADNPFLQHEKVVLKKLTEQNLNSEIIQAFTFPKTSHNDSKKSIQTKVVELK